MSPAVGPLFVAAALLLIGGFAKAISPRDTANALRATGLTDSELAVRAGGVLEAVIGGIAIVRGDAISALLVAASYVAFAAFVLLARQRGAPISSCGCFGKVDTPPTMIHVIVDVALAGAAVAVALEPGAGIADVVREQPMSGVPFSMLLVLGVALVFLSFTALPRTLALVTPRRAR